MGLGALVTGIVTVAFGEVIGVLFAIEENTRSAVKHLSEIARGEYP
jgi:uncharacterized membrane protein YqgA involved in biofilm formation